MESSLAVLQNAKHTVTYDPAILLLGTHLGVKRSEKLMSVRKLVCELS